MNFFKSTYLFFLAFVFSLFIGCSQNPTSYGTDEVNALSGKNGINISNNFDTSIYYFAVEQEYAARIFWAPEFVNENHIECSSQKLISYSEISEFESGDKIIFYYWTTQDPSSEEVQNFIISTK